MKPKTTIVPVSDKGMLKEFIEFPLELYKNCDKWVPAFEDDEYKVLGKDNPSLAFCERELFLARQDGKPQPAPGPRVEAGKTQYVSIFDDRRPGLRPVGPFHIALSA